MPAARELSIDADQLTEGGRLTLRDINEVAHRRSDDAKAGLPGELFCDREVPWQAIVRGHIVAALEVLPRTEETLAASLEEALAQLERA